MDFSTTSQRSAPGGGPGAGGSSQSSSAAQNPQPVTTAEGQSQKTTGTAYAVNFQHHHHKTSPPASPPRSGMSTPGFGGSGRYPRGGYYSPPLSPGGRSTGSGKEGCFSHVRMTSLANVSRYFRRLMHYRHMDFEFACWQMIYLLVAPQKVYRNFMYRKSEFFKANRKPKIKWVSNERTLVHR